MSTGPHGYTVSEPSSPQSSVTERAREVSQRVQHDFKSTVDEAPLPSVLVAFGVGLGVGTLIGAAIAGPVGLRQEHRNMAERVGHNILDALSGVIPDRLSDRLHG